MFWAVVAGIDPTVNVMLSNVGKQRPELIEEATAGADHVRDNLCKKTRELLVSKSTGVTSGWMLNYVITVSVAVVVAELGLTEFEEQAEKGGNKAEALLIFSITLAVFALVLVAAALASRAVMSTSLVPGKMKATYAAGLGFIPAWQWKGVISALMIMTVGGNSKETSPALVAAVVVGIAVLTSAVQVFLEEWASDAEKTSLTFQIVSQLKTSLGLGMGFAVNVLVHACVGSEMMQELIPQTIYVVVLTSSVALVQFLSKPKLAEMKTNGTANPFVLRTLGFLLVSTNFVVGWAWKGMVDVFAKDYKGVGPEWQLLVSFTVSFVLISLVVVMTILEGYATGAAVQLQELCMTASAMNIGWTWADFAMECLRKQKETLHGGKDVEVGHLWLFAFVVVACASIAAVVMDAAIRQAERSEDPESEALVK